MLRQKFRYQLCQLFFKECDYGTATNHDTTVVAKALLSYVASYFWVPACILSDNAAKFTSMLWDMLQDALDCTLIHTSPYYPQGDTIIERSYRTIDNLIRVLTAGLVVPDLVRALPSVQLTLNGTPHDPHNISPF